MQGSSDLQGDNEANLKLHGLSKVLAGQEEVFALAKPFDLINDSVTHVRAKVFRWRNQRIEFPAPEDLAESFRRRCGGTGWRVNGIFAGIFKTGPNRMCPFFRGSTHTGPNPDWKICVRDVIIKSREKDEHMLFNFRNRKVNKTRRFEFSLTEIIKTCRSAVANDFSFRVDDLVKNCSATSDVTEETIRQAIEELERLR